GLSPQDPGSVDMLFFDGRGVDIDAGMQRKVERNYYRDDLRRVLAHEIGDLAFPARGREYYIRELLNVVDTQPIRSRRPKLVVDYAYGSTCLTGPALLGRLGVDLLAANATLDGGRGRAGRRVRRGRGWRLHRPGVPRRIRRRDERREAPRDAREERHRARGRDRRGSAGPRGAGGGGRPLGGEGSRHATAPRARR